MVFNLTVQSSNFKDISIVDVSTMSLVNDTQNNITNNLPYSNYLLNVHSSSSQYSLNSFWSSISDVTQSAIFIFLILLLVSILFMAVKFIKRF